MIVGLVMSLAINRVLSHVGTVGGSQVARLSHQRVAPILTINQINNIKTYAKSSRKSLSTRAFHQASDRVNAQPPNRQTGE
jgi:uncharacterized phage-associated protein